ncbi:hypothetical protein [Lishizhenia sp.]|uniref:hypothetical protein n=1 Tax=Lishizhenia sp. TaxID=2497594 RepID=UPI00299F4F17|nr:hypothetical protein [Lishizhenia sp.]MDX1445582.1 hypothetical protein [Lishizhenia sp.]
MLKTLLLTSCLVFFSSFQEKELPNTAVQSQVYICKSTSAKRYHLKKSCRGLNACTHDIIAVSLAKARNTYSRTLCKWED